MADQFKVGEIVRGPDGADWLVIEQENNGTVGLTTWPATVVRSERFVRVGRAEYSDGSTLCRSRVRTMPGPTMRVREGKIHG